MRVNENKILKALKMIPKMSLFSNTELFTNRKENFDNDGGYEKKCYIELGMRLTVSLIIALMASSYYHNNNLLSNTAFLGIVVLSVVMPEVTLLCLILVIHGGNKVDMSNPLEVVTNTVSGKSKYFVNNNRLSDSFFFSETPKKVNFNNFNI